MLLLDGTRGLEAQDLKIADHVLAGGPGADHRDQQMGRGATTRAACSTASRRRSRKGSPRRAACRCSPSRGRTGKGLDALARRRLRGARDLVEAGLDRPAQPLVRGGGRAATRRRRRAASGSSCATSPRSAPGRRASSCSAPGSTSCPKATGAIWSTACASELGFGAVPVRLDAPARRAIPSTVEAAPFTGFPLRRPRTSRRQTSTRLFTSSGS